MHKINKIKAIAIEIREIEWSQYLIKIKKSRITTKVAKKYNKKLGTKK